MQPIIKSPSAFRTISEVAIELDIPPHVLRFWESRFPELRPVKRAGGRRYYRPEDVELVRRIQNLLYAEGYTIKGVQKVLRDQTDSDPADRRPGDAALDGGDDGEADRLSEGARRELQAVLEELYAIRDLLHGGTPL